MNASDLLPVGTKVRSSDTTETFFEGRIVGYGIEGDRVVALVRLDEGAYILSKSVNCFVTLIAVSLDYIVER